MEYTKPIGKVAKAFESVTVADTAIGLTAATAGTYPYAFISVEGAQIRFQLTANPTATVGHILEAGDTLTLDSNTNIKAIKFIRTGTTSGTIRVTYFDWVM